MDDKFDLITTGSKLIKKILKEIGTAAADTNAKKELTESQKLLDKKLKLMKKNEALAIQYADRTCYDTIQGVFQALHLYIISTAADDMVDEAVMWLRTHENCYEIADRMQKAALARADFSNGKKK